MTRRTAMPTRTEAETLEGPKRENPSRRDLLLGGSAQAGLALGAGLGLGVAAASSPAQALTRGEIDAGVRAALEELFRLRPQFLELYRRAEGVLTVPDVVKASFLIGGSYGEGALLVDDVTDSYWSYSAASIGFQAGAQRTRQALFIMTSGELARFRSGESFELGAEAELTVVDGGLEIGVDTTKDLKPVIAVVFGRQGLLGGASLQGGKYSRLYL